MWIIVDDGANSCCHGELWRRNAESKYAKLGYKIALRDEGKRNFKGIGSSQTNGRYAFAFGLRYEDEKIICGSLSSHEMPGQSYPMLMSQAAQAHLGGHERRQDHDEGLSERRTRSSAASRNRFIHDSNRPHVQGSTSLHKFSQCKR